MRNFGPALVCLSLLAVAFLATPDVAEARSNNMVIDHFYTDDTFTEAVGFQIVLRCGGTTGPLNGLRTEYVYWEQLVCIDWTRAAFGCKYELRDGYLGEVIWSFPITCPDHLRH